MEVILLEKIRKLGNLGDKVKVKPGFGRNFLIPSNKAVPANAENLAMFEARRAELEKAEQVKVDAAKARLAKLENLVVTLSARVSDEGKLYGSLGVQELADAISEAAGIEICKSEIHMPEGPIRAIGEYEYMVELHTDVETMVKVNVTEEH